MSVWSIVFEAAKLVLPEYEAARLACIAELAERKAARKHCTSPYLNRLEINKIRNQASRVRL